MLTAASAWTSWTFDPLALAVVVIAGVWYARGVLLLRRSRAEAWPVLRILSFGLGLLSIVAVTLWWVGAFAHTLFWVYTVQIMMLLVISPSLLMFGRPVTLARTVANVTGKRSILAAIADAPAMRVVSNPAFGALLLPLVTVLVFFTVIFPASLAHYVVYEVLHLVLLGAGVALALPLADEGVPVELDVTRRWDTAGLSRTPGRRGAGHCDPPSHDAARARALPGHPSHVGAVATA